MPVLPALWRVLTFVLAFASAVAIAAPWDAPDSGLPPVPALSGRVVDATRTLSEGERASLEAKLADWEARTTNQLVVAIVASTKPESIEEYSLRLAEAWKIGHKDKDNGALFVIAKDDKRMRIEVGYGLEGVLTDVTSRRIIGDVVAPYFKQGKFAAGIDAGVDKIIAVVAEGKPLPPPAERPRNASSRGGGFDIGTLVVLLIFIVPVVGGILRKMLGNVLGSTVGAGVVGVATWFVVGSVVIASIAGVISFIALILSLFGGRGPGGFIPMGGGGFGGGGWSGGGGGGGFSGGGGTFGGGGASGGWD